MKKILLFFLLTIAVYPQWDFGFGTTGGGGTGGSSRFSAVDLDGSTEYMYRNYASADSFLNLNGYERIRNANSTGFEITVGTWLNKGNHAIDTVTANKIYGNKSGQIISSGAGDSLANFVCLVPSATSYHGVTATNKYTLEFWSKSLYCVAGDSIIVYHGGNRKAYACSTVAQKRVFNYEASTFTAARDTIKIYTNNASGDTVLIDSVNFSQAYDATIEGWVYARTPQGTTISGVYNKSNGDLTGSPSAKGILLSYPSAVDGSGINFFISDGGSAPPHRINFSGYSASNANQWHLLTIMIKRDSTVSRLFVDGILVASATANVGNFNTTDNLYLGTWNTFSRELNGLLGEFRMTRFNNIGSSTWTYQTPLTTYNAYTRGAGFQDNITNGGKKIVLWLDFMDNSTDGRMFMDLSGNGYDVLGNAVTTGDWRAWKR